MCLLNFSHWNNSALAFNLQVIKKNISFHPILMEDLFFLSFFSFFLELILVVSLTAHFCCVFSLFALTVHLMVCYNISFQSSESHFYLFIVLELKRKEWIKKKKISALYFIYIFFRFTFYRKLVFNFNSRKRFHLLKTNKWK